MGRRRFTRDRHGRYRPGLAVAERDLLRRLPSEAGELVEEDEPDARRLFPVAYPGDPGAEREYRDMMGSHLLEHHRAALDTLVRTVDAPTLEEGDLQAWLGALEVMRLVVGTRLDVSEDFTGIDRDHPDYDEHVVYQYLSLLQEEIVEALTAALPTPGTATGDPP